ncbi:Branched-chain acyl-CoA dehydrogenase [Minicystis rosea]|nr:Branched-chain acyl-CoA dehydrogenase [Minicystis rosea]
MILDMTLPRLAATAILASFAALSLASCGTSSSTTAPDASAASPQDAAAEAAAALAELRDAAVDAALDAEAPDASAADAGAAAQYPGTSEGCPGDMVLVNGNYCPETNQVCLEHHEEFSRDEAKKKTKRDKGEDVGKSTVSERCLRYQEPSECLSKQRRPMRFCMDRFEWPNQKGELPALLVSWVDAKKECEKIGKRLCTEDEFNFACEGEQMLPYTYGYVRDATKCSIDKPYRKREKKLLKYASCMKKPECKKELERLDQRLPAGSLPACVSPFGVYDLNGNINEWVFRPKEKPPNRSGLKGGWWGPVRGRCRPTVGFHKEEDYGYEEGFRCCKDAAAR